MLHEGGSVLSEGTFWAGHSSGWFILKSVQHEIPAEKWDTYLRVQIALRVRKGRRSLRPYQKASRSAHTAFAKKRDLVSLPDLLTFQLFAFLVFLHLAILVFLHFPFNQSAFRSCRRSKPGTEFEKHHVQGSRTIGICSEAGN